MAQVTELGIAELSAAYRARRLDPVPGGLSGGSGAAVAAGLWSEAEAACFWERQLGTRLTGLSPELAAMLRYPGIAG